jgi:hypothetical protein
MIKSRRIGQVENVASVEEKRNECTGLKFRSVNVMKSDHLAELDVQERLILVLQ